MKLYRSHHGIVAEQAGRFFELDDLSWDDLVTSEDLLDHVTNLIRGMKASDAGPRKLLPPIGSQEVWAAGVTYYRSRDARMEESKDAGGGDFYDRVYRRRGRNCFSSRRRIAWSVRSQGRDPRRCRVVRAGAGVDVLVTPGGKIIGYTIGNDMSSRDIEGENPLYLPQAKVYDRAARWGPAYWSAKIPCPLRRQLRWRFGATARWHFPARRHSRN